MTDMNLIIAEETAYRDGYDAGFKDGFEQGNLKWNSFSENPPKKSGKYLVAYPLWGNENEYIYDVLYYGEIASFGKSREKCFYEWDSEWGDIRYSDIKYWAEVPKIRKEKDYE